MTGRDWDDLARAKLARVLGAGEGELVFEQAMRKLAMHRLRSPHDVYRLAQILKEGKPVVAAVGAMLALSAVMNGADPAALENGKR